MGNAGNVRNGVGLRGMRVGMWRIGVRMRGLRVGMRGIE